MDELLHGPHELHSSQARPSPLEDLTGALRRTASSVWETVQPSLHAVREWVERHPISPAAFLAAAGAAGVAAILITVYTPSYVVDVDGVEVGVVRDVAVYEQAEHRAEAHASQVLGYDYDMGHTVTYTRALSERVADFATTDQIETYLFDGIAAIMDGYVLTVDGVTIGAARSESDLTGLLDTIAAPYRTEDTVDYGFVEDVEIRNDYITDDFEQDLDEMFAILTENTTGETTYEVVSGDAYLAIAAANDMTLDELMALNPQASLDRLMVGDVLNVKKIIPYLSVYTVDHVTYSAPIECPVEYVDDPSQYVGNSTVITQGVQGEAMVTADVTYVNGYESERTIVESVTLSEPTTTVIAQGTAPRPKTASTGVYHWPINGRITSRFGPRNVSVGSSNHKGLDIGAYYGAPIAASDGGTVTYAGWMGGYGNLVIITHDNGTQTYYGHNTSVTVSVGQKVYQGQTIAKAGSTGNSTGPHCHFEIRINGVPVNPLNYLT